MSAPRGGSVSRSATFSKPGIPASMRIRYTMKSPSMTLEVAFVAGRLGALGLSVELGQARIGKDWQTMHRFRTSLGWR